MEQEIPNANTMQIQDLPAEILVRIFKRLNYRERVRIESVCKRWRATALDTWKDQHILRFSKEMLRLDEPWKDKKRINSIINDLNRQQSEVTAKMPRDYAFNPLTIWNVSELKMMKLMGWKEDLENYEERMQRIAMRQYWKIFTDPALYEQEKPSIQLAPLKAVLHRCAPFLDELHLHGHFPMGFSRVFFQMAHPSAGRLAHLHIDVPLNSWHLRKIQLHLAPQLLSLAVVPMRKALITFKELLANCNKLENLQIAEFDHHQNLFSTGEEDIWITPTPFDGNIEEGEGENGQGQPSSSLALTTTTSCCSPCSFMPSTLKYLLIHESHWSCGNPEKLVSQLLSLLAHCSQLRYMPILISNEYHYHAKIFELIEERDPRQLDKIIGLQFPFFIAKSYSFPYIHRPEFRNLNALYVDFRIGADEIRQIAICFPQLEHLGIRLYSRDAWNPIMEIPDLVVLHQFQQLSSLEIFMDFEMICPAGEQEDIAFLEILTELDQIHPLRSLDFQALSGSANGWGFPSLSQDYLLQMANQLKHLETFSCSFYLKNVGIDDMAGIGQFCEQLGEIFDSQQGANKKSFQFKLLSNGYEWDKYKRRERKDLFVEWQKGCGTKRSTMNWHCRPLTEREHWDWKRYFEPSRSIVLNELITSEFGQRTSSILFDSFGTMEEEEH